MKKYIFRHIAIFCVNQNMLFLLMWMVKKKLFDPGFWQSYLLRISIECKKPKFEMYEYLLSLPEIDPNCIESLPIRWAWRTRNWFLMRLLLEHPRIEVDDFISKVTNELYFFNDCAIESPFMVVNTDKWIHEYHNKRLPLGLNNNIFIRNVMKKNYNRKDFYLISIKENILNYLVMHPDVIKENNKTTNPIRKKEINDLKLKLTKKNRKKRIQSLQL